MYQSQSYSSLGIEGRLSSYASKPQAFTLADAVNEAYSCEGCRIAQERTSGRYDGPVSISAPKTYSEKSLLHSLSEGLGYGAKKSSFYGAKDSSAKNRVLGMDYTAEFGSQKYASMSTTYSEAPIIFLKEERQNFPIVENKEQIIGLAKETFSELMGRSLPENISISILPKEEFKILHSRFGKWSDGILGFAINGKEKKAFIKAAPLDELMMVLGHEIGHLNSESLGNSHDEEAKAFSFSEAWVRCIKKHNIGNLAESIKDEKDWTPAANGLHDVAFNFVRKMVGRGIAPMDLHNDLSKRYRSMLNHYV